MKQTAISDFTPSRVALVDYIPRPSIDQIAGIAPTLDLDFERYVYRHYLAGYGFEIVALSGHDLHPCVICDVLRCQRSAADCGERRAED
ncbi:MAG: hypothetical protein MZV65_31755 [Chromatiales bacterium]|nr:hypothetical protein [Chromatiales bacterium]